MANKNEKPSRAYDYLLERAKTQKAFKLDELANHVGWKRSTAQTYLSKLWKDFFDALGDDRYRVKKELLRYSRNQFLEHFTQKQPVYASYTRKKFEQVVTYEFLLPLTREGELRRALDDLFYSDTIERRLHEIGLDNLGKIIPRERSATDEDYLVAVGEVAARIGGYSISHVSGRFRAHSLVSRAEAGDLLAKEQRYLVDETTALVRFIVPIGSAAEEYGEDFDSVARALSRPFAYDESQVAAELTQIRSLFFHLFVEAVVRIINGEDEIWLIEDGPRRRLYTWSKVS